MKNNNKLKLNKLLAIFLLLVISHTTSASAFKRIITLSGALTETVDALGYGAQIVAVDVTSIYPAYINKVPKVSKDRAISAVASLQLLAKIKISKAPSGTGAPASSRCIASAARQRSI